MKQPRILITGVAGLLGSHLSRYLLDQGYDCAGIDDLSGGFADFVDPRLTAKHKFFQLNLLKHRQLENIFATFRPDAVFHLAAYAAEGLSPFIRRFNYQNNLICSVNVINFCLKYHVKKLIFTSSMAVYGQGQPPFSEDQIPKPADPYGVAKFSVEQDIQLAADQFGLDYSIVRPHNVIGIYQNIWDRYRNVIGIWIRKSIAGENIGIFGDGTQKRAFSDIKYYLEPFRQLIDGGSREIFNLGADKEFKLLDVAKMVQAEANKFGKQPQIEFLEPRHEVKDAYCSHLKAKKILNFVDQTNLETTIHEMFAWAMTQPARKVKKKQYELTENIYSYWK